MKKRLRVAKQILKNLQDTTETEDGSVEDDTKNLIADRLVDDIRESKNKKQFTIADKMKNLTFDSSSIIKTLKGHHLSVTSITLSKDEKILCSSSKDCSVIKWDMETGKKIATFKGSIKKTKKKSNWTCWSSIICFN